MSDTTNSVQNKTGPTSALGRLGRTLTGQAAYLEERIACLHRSLPAPSRALHPRRPFEGAGHVLRRQAARSSRQELHSRGLGVLCSPAAERAAGPSRCAGTATCNPSALVGLPTGAGRLQVATPAQPDGRAALPKGEEAARKMWRQQPGADALSQLECSEATWLSSCVSSPAFPHPRSYIPPNHSLYQQLAYPTTCHAL